LIFALDVHKSKLTMQELWESKVEKMNFLLVLFVILKKFSFINDCLNGNFKQGLYNYYSKISSVNKTLVL
jgi:hypothetical protein